MTSTSSEDAAAKTDRTLVVLQPGYLPWLGFFDQMRFADVFVYYDDVQYDKHGWRNRNRIKSPQGPHWLTVPVRHAGLGKPPILDVEVDNTSRWSRKHLGTLHQYYGESPHAARFLPELDALLQQPWQRLVDLDVALAARLASWLGIGTPVTRSSALPVGGERSERLLGLCRHVGATRYASGSAARTYLDVGLFERHGVSVIWQDYQHPVYPQLHGEFVPYLSALDLILNCGDDSSRVLGEGSRWTL